MARLYTRPGSPYIWTEVRRDPRRPGGKWRESTGTADKDLAQRILVQRMEEVEKLRNGRIAGGVLYTDFKAKFLQVRSRQSRDTYNIDRRALTELETVCKPQFAADVTPAMLERLIAHWRGVDEQGQPIPGAKVKGAAMANRLLRAITFAMKWAEDQTPPMAPPQRWRAVKRPFREPGPRRVNFSLGELVKIFRACDADPRRARWAGPAARLGYYAGLRREEMYWLARTDLDYARSRIALNPKDGWKGPKWWRPEDPVPWVPMPAPLKKYLRELPDDGPWVLGPNRPKPDGMTDAFRKILAKGKIAGFLHALRHTAGSQLVSSGKELGAVGEFMRHKDPRTTKGYAKYAPATVHAVVKGMPEPKA